jgi:hypothetical protein
MHQPNIFLNLPRLHDVGLRIRRAEDVAGAPEISHRRRSAARINDRNPEGAAPRGLWADLDFLRNVYDLNPELKDTQFADYHGHGWNFRAIFKRDREGNLLDDEGQRARSSPDDPEKVAQGRAKASSSNRAPIPARRST